MGYHTGEQFRAARAMLGWEQSELAQRSNVSIKTIKRVEATRGLVDAHSEWAIANALEMGGIEFVGDHDWRNRSDGVRFSKDRTGKMRRELVEQMTSWFDVTLKIKTDEDAEFFDRPNEQIVDALCQELRTAVERTVNQKIKA